MATKAAKKGAESEINRLRAQVRDLQAQLARTEADEDEPDNDREEDREETRARRDDGRYRNDIRVRKYQTAADEATDTAADLPVRLMDEAGKLTRALTFAYLEQLRAAADVFITFADEVTSRNRPQRGRASERRSGRQDEQRRSSTRTEESRSARPRDEEERGSERSGRRTITGLTTDLPADISSGFMHALNRSLDIPGRTVERFQSVYRETEEEAKPTLRPREERDENTRRSTSERDRSESRRSSQGPRSRSQRTTTRRSPISAEREEEAKGEAA